MKVKTCAWVIKKVNIEAEEEAEAEAAQGSQMKPNSHVEF